MSHGICSYISMYMNTVANNIMLQLHLLHYFYNTVFEIKHKLHIDLWSDPIPLPK